MSFIKASTVFKKIYLNDKVEKNEWLYFPLRLFALFMQNVIQFRSASVLNWIFLAFEMSIFSLL